MLKTLAIASVLVLAASTVLAREAAPRWLEDLETAKRLARSQRKPILGVLVKKGHSRSEKLLRDFASNPKIREFSSNFILVRLERSRNAALANRYSLTLSPSTLFLTDRGAPIKTVVGPVSSAKYLAQMKAAHEKYVASRTPRLVFPKPPEKNAPPVEPPDPVVAPTRDRISRSVRERAVASALAWLVKHQRRDGRWRKLPEEMVTENEEGRQLTRSIDNIDVALTAMAGMAFLAEGSTPDEGPHRAVLTRAVRFVAGAVRPDGVICEREGNDWLYLAHANFETPLGAMFLSEAQRARPDPSLAGKLDLVAAYLARVQDPATGAWGYAPDFREFPTHTRRGWRLLATTHCCLTALSYLREAGVDVDAAAIRRGARYLMNCLGRDESFVYRSEFRRGAGYAGASAGALYSLARSGVIEDKLLAGAWSRFRRRYRSFDEFGKHWWFMLLHAALALNHRGPGGLMDFESGYLKALIDGQKPDGSWPEPDGNGGMVYATAAAAIVLQLGDGRLPISSMRRGLGAAPRIDRPKYLKNPHPLSRVKVFESGRGYLVDLLVTTDGPDSPQAREQLSSAILGANRILYDVTNGQMSFHRVEVRTEGRGRDEADITIAMDFSEDAERNPHPFAHGITRISKRTEIRGTRETEGETIGDWVLLPYYHRGSREPIRWDSHAFVRVLAHELCHYLFGLPDEYGRRTGGARCWSIMGNFRSTELCRDGNHSVPGVARSCWSRAKALYPKLVIPEVDDPGPWEPPLPEIRFP